MTQPDPLRPNAPPPTADPGARLEENIPPVEHPEAALGGADAVEKTTWVVGRGTEPTATDDGSPVAHPEGGSGPNYLAWGAWAVAAAVAILYLVTLIA